MSLNKFTDGTNIKPWMNINCNSLNTLSLTTESLIVNSIKSNNIICGGQVQTFTIVNNGTFVLQASDLISGVIGVRITGSGSSTVNFQMPQASTLDAALSQFTQPMYFTTIVSISYSANIIAPVSFNLLLVATGIIAFDSSSPFSYTPQIFSGINTHNRFQTTLTFTRIGPPGTGWIVFG
jgi:hypothetical protein